MITKKEGGGIWLGTVKLPLNRTQYRISDDVASGLC